MRLPRADAPNVSRMADCDLRWQLLDRNEVEDRAINPFQAMLRAKLEQMTG